MFPIRKYAKPNKNLLKYLHRWQDNTNPNNLGIINFIFDIFKINQALGLPPLIRDFKPEYGVAPWVPDSLAKWFRYRPGMTKEEWCHVIATHREGSKTFWFSFALPLYLVTVGKYGIYNNGNLLPEFDYIVLRGKSSDESKKRILNIVNMLNKQVIVSLFGELRASYREIREKEGKDTGKLVILSNGYIIESSSIEQPSRGLNILQVRPKLFIFDDVQNKNNTKTAERRREVEKEIMEESFGALADVGSMIYIGNRVHNNDMLSKLLSKNNIMWKKHFYTLTVRKTEKGYLPGVGDLDNEVPLWSKRWTIERIKKLKEFYVNQPELGGIKGFLKEYYNRIVTEANYMIKYHDVEYFRENGINWIKYKDNDKYVIKNVFIAVANDPAISERKTSSDAVVVTVAVTPQGQRYVLDIQYGKWDIHDRYDDESNKKLIALEPKDLAHVVRKGSVEECIRHAIKYHADIINIEVAGQQLTFYNETVELARKLGITATIRPEPAPSLGKIEKLRQLPLIHFENGKYFIRKEHQDLKDDIMSFPDCTYDRLDALYLAEQVISLPNEVIYDPLGNYNRKIIRDEQIYDKIISGEFSKNYEPQNYINEKEEWVI